MKKSSKRSLGERQADTDKGRNLRNFTNDVVSEVKKVMEGEIKFRKNPI